MTELELLRLQVRGIPVHIHKSPKRGEWACSSPYCVSLLDEAPRGAPGEHPDTADVFDHGEVSNA